MSTVEHGGAGRRYGPLGLALGISAGFLCGVLLVAILGGAKPAIESRTVTVPATRTTGGTVVVSTRVPALVGQPLDVAVDRLQRSRFRAEVDGGGLFGIIDPSNWAVVAQSPEPGVLLEQGSRVRLQVERL
jgi:PASTA domain-containing protein